MLGVIYLLVCFVIGWFLLSLFRESLFPKSNSGISMVTPAHSISNKLILLPAAFIVGSILMVTTTMLSTYMFLWTNKPLLFANLLTFLLAGSAVALYAIIRRKKNNLPDGNPPEDPPFENKKNAIMRSVNVHLTKIKKWIIANRVPLILFTIVLIIWTIFTVRSFSVSQGTLRIGSSVWSDFGPHTAMIRSFSTGSNFPPQYHHFADGTMRYHFMFFFFAGNLEYLGLPIDLALNLPSILGFMAFIMLLYGFSFLITKSKPVSVISVALVFFRSSYGFISYIYNSGGVAPALQGLLSKTKNLGYTSAEEWGLWSLKPLLNQRHLPFAMGLLVLVLIIMTPHLVSVWRNSGKNVLLNIKNSLFLPDSWLPENFIRPVFIGVFTGLLSYFNGSVMISILLVLFFIALFSKRKSEFLIIAAISILISVSLSALFTAGGDRVVSPELSFGFMVPQKTPGGFLAYYSEVFGIYPLLLFLALLFTPGWKRIVLLACCVPVVFANTIKLSSNVMLNYKYIAIMLYIINIFIVFMLIRMVKISFLFFRHFRQLSLKIASTIIYTISLFLCAFTFFFLSITGIMDIAVLINQDRTTIVTHHNSPAVNWIKNNTDPHDVFLTDFAVYHPVLLAGRPIYNGWPYFAHSAGYNVDARTPHMRSIYNADSPEEVSALCERYNIDYVAINDAVRNERKFSLNESVFKNNFEPVYTGDDVIIYKP